MAEGGGLLNRCRAQKLYPGFESLPHRHPPALVCFTPRATARWLTDTMKSRRSLGEGGRIPASPPAFARLRRASARSAALRPTSQQRADQHQRRRTSTTENLRHLLCPLTARLNQSLSRRISRHGNVRRRVKFLPNTLAALRDPDLHKCHVVTLWYVADVISVRV